MTVVLANFAATAPADADEADVAKAIVQVVDMPFRKLPFRVHIEHLEHLVLESSISHEKR